MPPTRRAALSARLPEGGGPTDAARATALTEAVALHQSIGDLPIQLGVDADLTIVRDETVVLNTAEVFLAWLRGPAHLRLVPGPVVNQDTSAPTGVTPPEGVPVQIHDNEQFDLTLVETDAKGFPTVGATPPTWTSSDETVVPVSVSADGMTFSVVAGNVGSAVVTVNVTKDDGTEVSATEAVDVIAAGVAAISLTEGPVTTQP